ncbi:EthD domain-containing protein [Denitratisoma oestradiolicum]|uniref:Uncharacterized protein n=1 Tax=Denitratisoma oestradiolicum TaxID=311182 RepID=A0A6S6XNX6_9PROT|nr:EthD domain-containing protein [Denitratisoma oestradiolicum]TWO80579.1 hypothetical protein CBW56_09070 [Denitratisoma oestradiolicum]CAB1367651.1 conserved protein of unknown function [Denitratisoma oestradiolicum]
MEKVIYMLWRDPREDAEKWCQRIRGEVAEKLAGLGARFVQANVQDGHALQGAQYIQTSQAPAAEGVLQLWLDSANDAQRKPFDEVISAATWRMAAYLVSESQLLFNDRHPPKVGQRTECYAQIAAFQCPPRISKQHWLDTWRNSHSQIAIDTQDTFLYVQNLVVRPLTFGAPPYDAIVEEGFPEAALTSVNAFYDAVGDDGKLKRNVDAMMESCARFIDMNSIDVVVTSQYLVKPLA